MIHQGLRFFIAGGAILVLTGALQLVVRPPKPGEHRWINRGTIWAVFCVAMGVGAILVGSGVIPVGR
ncbi:MAG TPA: hypothetical protein VN914_07160 [Polyangia bacterium]|nr:hypothetical protein [Polyangia bacterium]